MKGLLKTLEEFKSEQTLATPTEKTGLSLNEKEFELSADIRKEFASIYRVRLSTLRPLVKDAAMKKWGTTNVNYNTTLLNVKPAVPFFLLHIVEQEARGYYWNHL